jgi:sensor histidine kinase YesM
MVFLGSAGLYVYKVYPDSIVGRLIVNRLVYDEEKGVAGNNRTSAQFDYYYKNRFLGTSNIVWGIGDRATTEGIMRATNSYKLFFVTYGFVGMASLFLLYFFMACSINSRLLMGLFILYCVSFLQRTYALWEMELFLFIGAAEVFHNGEKTVSSKIDTMHNW